MIERVSLFRGKGRQPEVLCRLSAPVKPWQKSACKWDGVTWLSIYTYLHRRFCTVEVLEQWGATHWEWLHSHHVMWGPWNLLCIDRDRKPKRFPSGFSGVSFCLTEEWLSPRSASGEVMPIRSECSCLLLSTEALSLHGWPLVYQTLHSSTWEFWGLPGFCVLCLGCSSRTSSGRGGRKLKPTYRRNNFLLEAKMKIEVLFAQKWRC